MPHDHGNGHGHGHGHACHDEHCDHDHSSDITPAMQNHLYAQIDFNGVRTLNESRALAGRRVLEKTWDQRLAQEPELESDADEQILVHIPFTGQVRLHSIHLRAAPDGAAPRTMRVFVNNPDLDFGNVADVEATQSFDLSQTSDVQDLAVKRAKFTTCRALTLFIEDNFGGDDVTKLSYLGFKGDFLRLSREPVEVLYEAAARPSDHKVGAVGMENSGGMGIGGGAGGRTGF